MTLQPHSTAAQDSRPQAVFNDLVTQELGKETLIYNLKTNQAFCLNDTTAEVWRAYDGQRSVTEISQLLSRQQRTDFTEDIVWLALEQLAKNNMLVESGQLALEMQGLSRRTMLKRAAFATVIALPSIAALVAPTAAHAASGGANPVRRNRNGACMNDCAVVGEACGCAVNNVTCEPGSLVEANVGAGVCVTADAAATALGVGVAAGANGNVCLIADACLL